MIRDITHVTIIHNPFECITEFYINENEIPDTSKLREFIKTPMKNWVSAFLPQLIEECNDDEVEIFFKGLQIDFDYLEQEVIKFNDRNKECHITLRKEIYKNQFDRIEDLNQIINTSKEIISHENIQFGEDIFKSITGKEILNVIILGGTDNLKEQLTDNLIGKSFCRDANPIGHCFIDDDNFGTRHEEKYDEEGFLSITTDIDFISSEYCQMKVYEMPDFEKCDEKYIKITKSKIDDKATNSLIIFIINENHNRHDEYILDIISEKYKVRGKQNKQRFIFVSNYQQADRKYLNSEFGIKNANIFAPTDITRIRETIDMYQQEVCLVKHVKKLCGQLSEVLGGIICKLTENINTANIHFVSGRKYLDAYDMLHNCVLETSSKYDDDTYRNNDISNFFMQAELDLIRHCATNTIKKNKSDSLVSSAVMSLTEFVKQLKQKYHEYLEQIGNNFHEKVTVNNIDRIIELYKEITGDDITDDLNLILDELNTSYLPRDLSDSVSYHENLIENIIDDTIVSDKRMFAIKSTEMMNAIITTLKDGSRCYHYDFYEKLLSDLTHILNGPGSTVFNSLNKDTIDQMKVILNEALNMTTPVLKKFFSDCKSSRCEVSKKAMDVFNKYRNDLFRQISIKHEKYKQHTSQIEEIKNDIDIINELILQTERAVQL